MSPDNISGGKARAMVRESQESEEAGQVRTGRGLEPLEGKGLTQQVRELALYLRRLRSQSGLTSAALAEQLGLDAGTVSRYLSGDRLPELSVLGVMQDLAVSATGQAVSDEERREGRSLLYEAARARGPLPFYQVELALAREALAEQEARSRREIAELTDELARERLRRQEAEKVLETLQGAVDLGAQVDAERLETLGRARDQAAARVAELEDRVRQYEALSRLLHENRERIARMATDTVTEVEAWYTGARISVEPDVARLETADEIVMALEDARDTVDLDRASVVIAELISRYDSELVANVVGLLHDGLRPREADRIAVQAAVRWPVQNLVRLAITFREANGNTSWGYEKMGSSRKSFFTTIASQRTSGDLAKLLVAMAERADADVDVNSLARAIRNKRGSAFAEGLRVDLWRYEADVRLSDLFRLDPGT
ncbi:helix-turn-helix domain-containing protein [Streptoverticillium reticulum]|uniref:helix-turn-helix domain-containing protein n=1 Tax=Streptoverticillium reticulum TaxID=1433415 RepID=UPI0039BF22E9